MLSRAVCFLCHLVKLIIHSITATRSCLKIHRADSLIQTNKYTSNFKKNPHLKDRAKQKKYNSTQIQYNIEGTIYEHGRTVSNV